MNGIKNAIKETYIKYGRDQVKDAIMKALKESDFTGFTRRNNSRKILESKYQKNIKGMEMEILIKFMSKTGGFDQRFQDLKDGTYMIGRERVSLERMVDSYLYEIIEEIENEKEQEREETDIGISNVNTYSENLNQLGTKMITGLTHDKEGSIKLANMQATTSIGNRRQNQEDAVLLKTHPKNPKFKIMAVSDGMGGGEKGEEASAIMVEKINEWFENLPENYFSDMENLQKSLKEKIEQISNEIKMQHNGTSGATIVASIIGKEETLIANVGDSRAYKIKDGKLEQVTRDDSQVQNMYEAGIIKEKDDMRFNRNSNKVTQIAGYGSGSVAPTTYRIKNEDYDKLLLFSDGVTDCLSDDQIKIITARSDRKSITQNLVKASLMQTSFIRPKLRGNSEYYDEIPGGKDNTTAAVYERE